MLRLMFLITALLIANAVSVPQSNANLTRLTNTPEHAVNLNPSLSDDGRVVVFESSADLVRGGPGSSFHAFRAGLDGPTFREIGSTRAVSPALSSDGKIIVFASAEDLVGRNADRNSEILMFDGSVVKQLTETSRIRMSRDRAMATSNLQSRAMVVRLPFHRIATSAGKTVIAV